MGVVLGEEDSTQILPADGTAVETLTLSEVPQRPQNRLDVRVQRQQNPKNTFYSLTFQHYLRFMDEAIDRFVRNAGGRRLVET